MGNRAVITTDENEVGVYLHWNGGRNSVDAFLAYCKTKDYRSPDDDDYGWACLANVICNFFTDGLSCGINLYDHLDTNNGDNGVYIIKGWKVVGRKYAHRKDKLTPLDSLIEFMQAINERQPKQMQISNEEIKLGAEKYLEQYAENDDKTSKTKSVAQIETSTQNSEESK